MLPKRIMQASSFKLAWTYIIYIYISHTHSHVSCLCQTLRVRNKGAPHTSPNGSQPGLATPVLPRSRETFAAEQRSRRGWDFRARPKKIHLLLAYRLNYLLGWLSIAATISHHIEDFFFSFWLGEVCWYAFFRLDFLFSWAKISKWNEDAVSEDCSRLPSHWTPCDSITICRTIEWHTASWSKCKVFIA